MTARADDPVFEEIELMQTQFDPWGGMLNPGDGYFYSSARWAGSTRGGAIFRVAPNQPTELLHSFALVADDNVANAEGSNPSCGMVIGPDGAFYGATQDGGAYAGGTIFRYSADGVFSVIRHIGQGDPISYVRALVSAPDGYLYGVADGGKDQVFDGVLFRISTSGVLEPLYFFGKEEPGAVEKPKSPVTLAVGSDGKLYGTTMAGGPPSFQTNPGNVGFILTHGVFFRYDAPGEITVLADFDTQKSFGRICTPTDGGFYVTTGNGLVHLDLTGTKTELANFTAAGKGDHPTPTSAVMTDDGLFGITFRGGEGNGGFVYRYVPGQGVSYVHDFGADYKERSRSLAVGNDGLVYGIATYPDGSGSSSSSSSSLSTSGSGSAAKAKAKASQTGGKGPRSFRLRAAAGGPNFVPVAKLDTVWLPAKAVNGKREILINVLANDRDPDKDKLTLVEIGAVTHGTAEIVPNPKGARVRFTTTEADPGNQQFTYTVSDGKGGTATGTVAIRSRATGSFRGTATSGAATGDLKVVIGKNNSASATFTVGGSRYIGKALLDLQDTADVTLKAKGKTAITLHLSLERGATREVAASVAVGSDTYTATCTPVTKK